MFIKHLSGNLAHGWDLLGSSHDLSPVTAQEGPLSQASHPPPPMPFLQAEEECLVGVYEETEKPSPLRVDGHGSKKFR